MRSYEVTPYDFISLTWRQRRDSNFEAFDRQIVLIKLHNCVLREKLTASVLDSEGPILDHLTRHAINLDLRVAHSLSLKWLLFLFLLFLLIF